MDMPTFIEYMKLHLLSIQQDAEKLETIMEEFEGDYDSDEYRELEVTDIVNTGEMMATQHILSVAQDMIG